MFKRFLPFIIASILAIVLSFWGTAQAVIGCLGLLFAFVLCIKISSEDESEIRNWLENMNEQVSKIGIKSLDINISVSELDRRLRLLERNQTGSDPFGG